MRLPFSLCGAQHIYKLHDVDRDVVKDNYSHLWYNNWKEILIFFSAFVEFTLYTIQSVCI